MPNHLKTNIHLVTTDRSEATVPLINAIRKLDDLDNPFYNPNLKTTMYTHAEKPEHTCSAYQLATEYRTGMTTYKNMKMLASTLEKRSPSNHVTYVFTASFLHKCAAELEELEILTRAANGMHILLLDDMQNRQDIEKMIQALQIQVSDIINTYNYDKAAKQIRETAAKEEARIKNPLPDKRLEELANSYIHKAAFSSSVNACGQRDIAEALRELLALRKQVGKTKGENHD